MDKTVKIKIGDREFEIEKFNMNDIINIEEKLGDIRKIGEKISNIRYILWYAISKTDKKITEEEVGRMISVADMNKVIEKFMEAVDITGNPIVTPKR